MMYPKKTVSYIFGNSDHIIMINLLYLQLAEDYSCNQKNI